jgi:hypothetical protein
LIYLKRWRIFNEEIVFIWLFGFFNLFAGLCKDYKYAGFETENVNYNIKPLYIDSSFGSQELKTIESVVAEWNYVLNKKIILKIEPNAIDHTNTKALRYLSKQIMQTHEGIVIIGINHDDPLVEDNIEEYDGTLAYVNGLGERANLMVVIRDRMGYKDMRKILLHEFGHALGAHHVNIPSLMYPFYGKRQVGCVDNITVMQIATINNLTFKDLNYCNTPEFK